MSNIYCSNNNDNASYKNINKNNYLINESKNYNNENTLSIFDNNNLTGLTLKCSTPSLMLSNSSKINAIFNLQLFKKFFLEPTINNNEFNKNNKSNKNLYSLLNIICKLLIKNIDSQKIVQLFAAIYSTQIVNNLKLRETLKIIIKKEQFQQNYSSVIANATALTLSSSLKLFNNKKFIKMGNNNKNKILINLVNCHFFLIPNNFGY